jgi:hypothetical protein
MPTRILSWAQMVSEADPNFRNKSLHPWVYEFSNGRLFVEGSLYQNYDAVGGQLILDDLSQEGLDYNPLG